MNPHGKTTSASTRRHGICWHKILTVRQTHGKLAFDPVTFNGIRFITLPQPAVKVEIVGQNARVSWPAAAVGWVLESSESLEPASWQTVPMDGVMVANGSAWLTVPRTEGKMFYRLRGNN